MAKKSYVWGFCIATDLDDYVEKLCKLFRLTFKWRKYVKILHDKFPQDIFQWKNDNDCVNESILKNFPLTSISIAVLSQVCLFLLKVVLTCCINIFKQTIVLWQDGRNNDGTVKDLNLGPLNLQSGALPTELFGTDIWSGLTIKVYIIYKKKVHVLLLPTHRY